MEVSRHSPRVVPTIDIGPFLGHGLAARHAVVEAVEAACREVGFLVISGHGIPEETLQRAFSFARTFFDLPQATKDRWHPQGPSKQRGYHGFATRALAYTLDEPTPPDLRESVYLGPIDDHRAAYSMVPAAQPLYWPNTIPTQPAGIANALLTLYRDFERLAADLLRIMALALAMPETHFVDKIDKHFSILACHDYPALQHRPLPGQLRTGAHTDYGAMTILAMTDATGGLEV